MPEELFGPGFAFSKAEILTYEEINKPSKPLPRESKIRITGKTAPSPWCQRADQAFAQDGARSGQRRPTSWDSRNSLILFAKPVPAASASALTRSIRQSPVQAAAESRKIWAAVVRARAMGFGVKLNTVIKKA